MQAFRDRVSQITQQIKKYLQQHSHYSKIVFAFFAVKGFVSLYIFYKAFKLGRSQKPLLTFSDLHIPHQPVEGYDSCFDVAIVGAGPAGSACAYHLSRLGRSVILIEKDKFPRE